MNVSKGLRAERLIAKRYEERGYAVTMEPPPSAIPFSLGNYKPDILASKGEENVLIEVKGPGARTDSQVYLKVDQEVQRHPGWRFLLATVADEELRESAESTSSSLSVESIREHLRQLDGLLDMRVSAGLLLPQLWLAYVGALRLLAESEGDSLETFTDLSLINRAYSDGITSIDEYEAARRLLKVRNDAVHSLETVATLPDCEELRRMLGVVLQRLEHPGGSVVER